MHIPSNLRFHIDVLTRDEISGWFVHEQGVGSVRVLLNGVSVGEATIGIPRPDVAAAFPSMEGSSSSGFHFLLRDEYFDAFTVKITDVTLVFTSAAGATFEVIRKVPTLADASISARSNPRIDTPLPSLVAKAVSEVSDDPVWDLRAWNNDKCREAVDILLFLNQNGSRRNQHLFSYFLSLVKLHHTFKFINKNFPKRNRDRALGDKDSYSVATSAEEMLTISHHLLALKSVGECGPFVEFGCFKGFSSSCLSHTCHLLGWRFHIFDSFCGLPPSESTYYGAGEFSGSRAEVECNVTAFGIPSVITFHEGFFSDTVPSSAIDAVSCIWMDVDLESSSRDASKLISSLSPRGCVFSHECAPEFFNKHGRIVVDRNPESVLPPIVSALESRNMSPVGKHLFSTLGVVTDPRTSVPVLDSDSLLRLVEGLI